MFESVLDTVICLSLATWGITFGLVHRNGAFGTMRKIREWSLQYDWSPLFCVYCTGFWVAMIFAYVACWGPVSFFVLWFGAAGGSWLIDSISERLVGDTEAEKLIRSGK